MVKEIVRDENFLKNKSEDLKPEELYMVEDLKDTLKANIDRCVGMAGNMIGYLKNFIVIVLEDGKIMPLINPVIISKKDAYETEEGCLSLDGVRKTTRYKKIKVSYLNEDFKPRFKVFKDFEAQIILHECDHLLGIII